jgi:hypothetical protein
MFNSQGAQICSSQKTLAFLLEYRQMPLILDIPLRGSVKLLLEQQVDFLFKLQCTDTLPWSRFTTRNLLLELLTFQYS